MIFKSMPEFVSLRFKLFENRKVSKQFVDSLFEFMNILRLNKILRCIDNDKLETQTETSIWTNTVFLVHYLTSLLTKTFCRFDIVLTTIHDHS